MVYIAYNFSDIRDRLIMKSLNLLMVSLGDNRMEREILTIDTRLLYETKSAYTFDEYKKATIATNKHLHYKLTTQSASAFSISIFLILTGWNSFEGVATYLGLSVALFPISRSV